MAEGGIPPTPVATSSKHAGASVPVSEDEPNDLRFIDCYSNLEIEEVEDNTESATMWKRCQKNPGHTKFIPASEFSLEHLPLPYRKNLYLVGIRALSRLTVRIRVKYTSNNRPDGDPSAKLRGKKKQRVGTGLIHELLYDKKFTGLEGRDYKFLPNPIADKGMYVTDGDPDDVDIDGFKRTPTEITLKELLNAIKSLRKRLGLGEVDEYRPSDSDDEADNDEYYHEKKLLAEAPRDMKIDGIPITEYYNNRGQDDSNSDDYGYTYGFDGQLGNLHLYDLVDGSDVSVGYDDDDIDDNDDDDGGDDDNDDCHDDDDDDDDDDCHDDDGGGNDDDDDDDDDDVAGSRKHTFFKKGKHAAQKPHVSFSPPNLSMDDQLNDTYRSVDPCPCPECGGAGRPHGYYVNVMTARHVVFDNSEAEHTVIDLFYDSEDEKGVKHMYGLKAFEMAVGIDWVMIMCVTHDFDLVWKLRTFMGPMLKRVKRMRKKSTTPLAVICSHPHGYAKQVSIGEWTSRFIYPQREFNPEKDHQKTRYLYKTPTCPGSSGAAVLILGQRQWTQVLNGELHPHCAAHDAVQNKGGIHISTDLELNDLPAPALVKALLMYEEMEREESQRGTLDKGTMIDRARRAEKLKQYLEVLKERERNRIDFNSRH